MRNIQIVPFLAAFLVSLLLFFLMPLSMYDANPSEFPMVAYSELLFYSGILTIVGTIALYSALLAVERLSPRSLLPAIGLIVGFSVAIYAQGNLIGADYGVLDGRAINWEAMRTVGIVNSLIWAGCILIPVTIAVLSPKLTEKCFRYVVPIFLAYVALLSVVLAVSNASALGRKKPVGFSMDKLMELSSSRNMVVIILDSFDRGVFDRILEEEPVWRDRFKGFTYYHNAVSAYCYTSLALPQIVSGYAKPEDGLTIWQYQRNAYREAPFLKKAKELGFTIDAYYDENVCPLADEFDGFDLFGNVIENAPKLISIDNLRHYASLYLCSVFRYLPHGMKKLWWRYQNAFMERFYLDMSCEKVEAELSERLETGSFVLVPERKVKIYHCSSLHIPTFSLQKARENLQMVCRFLDKVKAAGVYDKMDFFIMADHGSINRCRPLFMCSNGTSEFKVSEMPLSYRHLCEAFVDSLHGRRIKPIQAAPSEMVPLIDDPKRGKMEPVDEKYFDGIGTVFVGNGLELLPTTEGLNVVVTNGNYRMLWNGCEAIIGVPVEKSLRDEDLTLKLIFDGELLEDGQIDFSVQHSNGPPQRVRWATKVLDGCSEVILKIPDRPDDSDNRMFKLILHPWHGSATEIPVIIKLGVVRCE